MKNGIIILLLFVSFFLRSQKRTVDSLKTVLSSAKHDTTRCAILSILAETAGDDEWPAFNEELKKITEQHLQTDEAETGEFKRYRKYYALSLNNAGYLLGQRGKPLEALDLYLKALALLKGSDDISALASAYNNIAYIFKVQGNFTKALEYYAYSLKLLESQEKKDLNGIGSVISNLGVIYEINKDPIKALEYYERSLELREKTGDVDGQAVALNNLGHIWADQDQYEKALVYFERSLKKRIEAKNKYGEAIALGNIALQYDNLMQMDKAKTYYDRTIKIQQELDNNSELVHTFSNLSHFYFKLGQKAKALEFAKQCMLMAKRDGFPEEIATAASVLYFMNNKVGNYKDALENLELRVKMDDSLSNEANRKASIRSQLKYEYEKKAAADSVSHSKESEIKNVELKRQSAEIKAKKNQQYALFGGLVLVCIFGAFMYNRFKVTQKQKGIIENQKEVVEEQKKLVEEKQKEILDSIKYARRIQLAQIPSEKRVQSMLNRMR